MSKDKGLREILEKFTTNSNLKGLPFVIDQTQADILKLVVDEREIEAFFFKFGDFACGKCPHKSIKKGCRKKLTWRGCLAKKLRVLVIKKLMGEK